MLGCICYFEFDDEYDYCVRVEDAEKVTLELIYIVIVDNWDCVIEYVISKPIVTEIV